MPTTHAYDEEMKELLKPVWGLAVDCQKPKGYYLVKIANWYMTHITEPVLVSDKALSTAFNVVDKGYDEAMIWFALMMLPTQVKNVVRGMETTVYLCRLYAMTQSAIPEDLRGLISLRYSSNGPFEDFSQEVQDKILEFNEWCFIMRDKLENYFLQHYWTGNKMKQIEFILSKVYREHFNDQNQFRYQPEKVLEAAKEVQIELIEVANEEEN